MGIIDKLKNNYDYRKVDKFTKRRISQSQFGSHDREYYEQVYRDGDYLDPSETETTPNSPNYLHYKQSRWSLNDLLKKSHKKPSTIQSKTVLLESFKLAGDISHFILIIIVSGNFVREIILLTFKAVTVKKQFILKAGSLLSTLRASLFHQDNTERLEHQEDLYMYIRFNTLAYTCGSWLQVL